jgi:hypothetical protein
MDLVEKAWFIGRWGRTKAGSLTGFMEWWRWALTLFIWISRSHVPKLTSILLHRSPDNEDFSAEQFSSEHRIKHVMSE